LADFAHFAGIGPTQPCVIVLDEAGWHRSQKVILPASLRLVPLPANSPELPPAERLWPLTTDGVANQCLADLEALTSAQRQRCEPLQQSPQVIQRLTLFQWWPRHGNDH